MTETETVTSAVAKRDTGPEALIGTYKDAFATILPSHIKVDAFTSLAIYALRRNADLVKAATANPGSFIAAVLDCARLGLQPGDTFHFVPFGREIVGITDWTGEVELIYNAGAVSSVVAEIVRANDGFEYVPGINERPIHKADWFSDDRGDMVGVYAYAVMKDGATSKVVVMNRADIAKIRAVSKTQGSPSSPWNKWEDRMWRKSAVKQLAHWVPSDPEIRSRQIEAKNLTEGVRLARDLPAPSVDHDPDEVVDGEFVDDPENCPGCSSVIGGTHDEDCTA